MTGVINCASSKELNLIEVKALSKKIGVTINNIATTAVSKALKTFFKDQGEDIKSINIAIPANIRFEFYDKREKVKLENKFSAVPLEIPLVDDMQNSYPKIQNITKVIKNSIT